MILQFGFIGIASNNRTFTYPITFGTRAIPVAANLTPQNFDNYKCVTYFWNDSNLSTVHIISTSQNTPGVFIIAIGF